MLNVTAAGWAFTLSLGALFAWESGAHRPPTARSGLQRGGVWSLFYIAVALVFGGLAGWDLAAQYFAGYIGEKSLSVDKLFVFLIIMSTFAVPVSTFAVPAEPQAVVWTS